MLPEPSEGRELGAPHHLRPRLVLQPERRRVRVRVLEGDAARQQEAPLILVHLAPAAHQTSVHCVYLFPGKRTSTPTPASQQREASFPTFSRRLPHGHFVGAVCSVIGDFAFLDTAEAAFGN